MTTARHLAHVVDGTAAGDVEVARGGADASRQHGAAARSSPALNETEMNLTD